MVLAELEVRHSRVVAPTRRVALGSCHLPIQPAPGFGGILLAGVVAAHVNDISDEDFSALLRLVDEIEMGRRIPQPRLRHRFQSDVVGLDRSRHRLLGNGERVRFEFDDHAGPVPQILGAVYAAAGLGPVARPIAIAGLRRALHWDGGTGRELVEFLLDPTASAHWTRRRGDPLDAAWALGVLGFGDGDEPPQEAVRRRFRTLIRNAHPDHGGRSEGAGERVLELTEARRILLD
ncbi:MAG: hypothetical protein ACYDAD_06160 [Acidimicrobiales bacterium]